MMKIVLLFVLFGFASSLLHQRTYCHSDPLPPTGDEPTTCVNYLNTVALDEVQTQLMRGLEELNTNIRSLERELRDEVVNLKRENEVKRVAFSASIVEAPGVFTGPSSPQRSQTLVFNKVMTNIGNAYDKTTGIFTAPVKGVYHFTFMTFGYNSHTSGAILAKNSHYQVSTWEFKGADASDTTSNTVILNLNARDRISIILWRGGKVHTCVFSGFLLFPS